MPAVADIVAVVKELAPERVLEVGTGRRVEVAEALREAMPDADVVVSDRVRPDPPDDVRAIRLDLLGEAHGPSDVDVVLATRLPPELWGRAEALADRHGADLVLVPLAEETAPEGYEQVRPGLYLRPGRSG